MNISAPITLCARSDLQPERFYSGSLANLGIYNVPLTAAQIASLYTQVPACFQPHPQPPVTATIAYHFPCQVTRP